MKSSIAESADSVNNATRNAEPAIIVVGTSMGGLRAMQALLSGLPEDFWAPVVLLQHRGTESDDALTALLREFSALPVREAEDKMVITPQHVYLAPSGYHLLVDNGSFALSTDAPVRYARPSIDVLFESAAEAYREGTVGVILTGASDDGAHGAAAIKQRGGLMVVQDPSTSECVLMPRAAIAAAAIDRVLPLSEISSFLVEIGHKRRPGHYLSERCNPIQE